MSGARDGYAEALDEFYPFSTRGAAGRGTGAISSSGGRRASTCGKS
ncbi:hypothetical protein [Paraeggerthella hongkongensis]